MHKQLAIIFTGIPPLISIYCRCCCCYYSRKTESAILIFPPEKCDFATKKENKCWRRLRITGWCPRRRFALVNCTTTTPAVNIHREHTIPAPTAFCRRIRFLWVAGNTGRCCCADGDFVYCKCVIYHSTPFMLSNIFCIYCFGDLLFCRPRSARSYWLMSPARNFFFSDITC